MVGTSIVGIGCIFTRLDLFEKFPIGYLAFVLIKNHVFMDLLKELFDGAFEEKLGIFENGVTAAVTKLMKVAPSGFSSPSLIEAICQDVRAEAEVPPGSVMAKTISAMVKYALVTMSGRAALQQSDLPPHVGIAPFEARKSTP